MGAERTHPIKNERNCAHQFPSFVYRQDGHELSSSIACILSFISPAVKRL
jgi:hypothetical protein